MSLPLPVLSGSATLLCPTEPSYPMEGDPTPPPAGGSPQVPFSLCRPLSARVSSLQPSCFCDLGKWVSHIAPFQFPHPLTPTY